MRHSSGSSPQQFTALSCLNEIVTLSPLVGIMLIPFFGFTELRRVFGPERLSAIFFRPRNLWNLPANEALSAGHDSNPFVFTGVVV